MAEAHNPRLRFGVGLQEAAAADFQPSVEGGPPLPPIDYARVGKTAPALLSTSSSALPRASAVVISWADAEWAALQHVFCTGEQAMPYSARTHGSWPGWQRDANDLAPGGPSSWTYWGEYRLVAIGGSPVLLFKSNTHLDWPGASFLEALVNRLASQVQPSVILSVGTAGGAKPQDHVGTVRAVSAGTLFESGQPAGDWPTYANGWDGDGGVLADPAFADLLFPPPTTQAALQTLADQFNQHFESDFSLAQLDPNGLNLADPAPQIDDQTGGAVSLLTTSTFVVGTTAGTYDAFAAIEMDDAVIGKACAAANIAFGFVRNISDPVQNADLPSQVQGRWGSAVYDAYGFYTSYNGALAAWALLS